MKSSSSTVPVITIAGLIVLMIIGGAVFLMIPPGINSAREAARRAACLNNLKNVGLGFQNMESAMGRFPPSCTVKKDDDGKIIAVSGAPGAGWSWCVHILPYVEHSALQGTLDTVDGYPLQGDGDASHPHSKVLGYVIAEFHCPSFEGCDYVDVATQDEAITNYKAIAATHMESLSVASLNPATPKYLPAPEAERHPDGAIYPGSTHGINGFKRDGSAHTAIVVESVEQSAARWTVGNECAVVTLPPPVTFAKNYPYYHPTGYTANMHWEKSTIPPNIDQTYLDWDYDASPYSGTGSIKYGPSSHHTGVTNHCFADGSVHAISNQIDAALYFFLSTRGGGEPLSPLVVE